MKKTRLMREVEDFYKGDIEALLTAFRFDDSMTNEDIGIRIGVSTTTVGKWIKNAGLQYKQLARKYIEQMRGEAG